jgi:hypothetical protein
MAHGICSVSLSSTLVNSCKLFLSTAGTEAMFADLGYFTAASLRVCKIIIAEEDSVSKLNLWVTMFFTLIIIFIDIRKKSV